MRAALIQDGVVVNIIVADPSVDASPDGYLMIGDAPDFVTLGTVWDGEKFIAPLGASPVQIDGIETV